MINGGSGGRKGAAKEILQGAGKILKWTEMNLVQMRNEED